MMNTERDKIRYSQFKKPPILVAKFNIKVMDVAVKKMSYAEFHNLKFDDNDPYQYELIEGEIVRKSSPTIRHQRISGNIYFQIRTYLQQNPVGEVFSAPLDVVLEEHTAPQPDVFFVSKEREFILDEEEGVVIGTPDLIVEIISPSSVKKDRYEKKDLYERFGVREFWLADPNNRTVEIFTFSENAYRLHGFADEESKATSTVLPGFEVDVAKLMPE